jgi:hypothetical protein
MRQTSGAAEAASILLDKSRAGAFGDIAEYNI